MEIGQWKKDVEWYFGMCKGLHGPDEMNYQLRPYAITFALLGLSISMLRIFSEPRRNFWNLKVGSALKDRNWTFIDIPNPLGLFATKKIIKHEKRCPFHTFVFFSTTIQYYSLGNLRYFIPKQDHLTDKCHYCQMGDGKFAPRGKHFAHIS